LSFRPGNSSKTKISLTCPKPPEILRELNQEPIGGGTRSSRTNYNPRISENSEQYFKKKNQSPSRWPISLPIEVKHSISQGHTCIYQETPTKSVK
jgi:hypothetical protein